MFFYRKFRDHSTLEAEGSYNISGYRGSVTDDTPYYVISIFRDIYQMNIIIKEREYPNQLQNTLYEVS